MNDEDFQKFNWIKNDNSEKILRVFFLTTEYIIKKLEERILSAQSKEPNKSSFRTKKKGKIIENKTL